MNFVTSSYFERKSRTYLSESKTRDYFRDEKSLLQFYCNKTISMPKYFQRSNYKCTNYVLITALHACVWSATLKGMMFTSTKPTEPWDYLYLDERLCGRPRIRPDNEHAIPRLNDVPQILGDDLVDEVPQVVAVGHDGHDAGGEGLQHLAGGAGLALAAPRGHRAGVKNMFIHSW